MNVPQTMPELISVLDDRYRRIDDCTDISGGIKQEAHDYDKRLVALEFQQKVNNWLTAAIASGIIALVIKAYINI